MTGGDQAAVFSRTMDLLGPEAFSRLQRSLVVVVGLGGVGSHAAVALARAGIGALRLVDADLITFSSLNRHAMAGIDDVGRPKCTVLQEQLHRIRPDLPVEPLQLFVDDDTMPSVLREEAGPVPKQASRVDEMREDLDALALTGNAGVPEGTASIPGSAQSARGCASRRQDPLVLGLALVVDAIDSLGPKTALLTACCERGLPVVSSMGASSRTDPTAIRIADLLDTEVCPLARQLRKRLRRRGLGRGITTVYSCEPARQPLPPDHEDDMVLRGRVRHRQPSLSTLPGIFGYTLANVALLILAGEERLPV